ncbi:hypothetical protein ACLOJK_030596 [Asimina triloba]
MTQTASPNSTAVVDVGVILDLETWVGKLSNTCISMALSDFNIAPGNHNTTLVLHVRDSKKDVVGASEEVLSATSFTSLMQIAMQLVCICSDDFSSCTYQFYRDKSNAEILRKSIPIEEIKMPADPKATQTHQASKKELFCAGSSASLSRENVDGSVRRPIGSPDKREVLSSDSWLECGENGGEGDGEEEKQYLSQPGPTLMGNGDGGVGGEEDAGEAKSILPMLLPIRNMKEKKILKISLLEMLVLFVN